MLTSRSLTRTKLVADLFATVAAGRGRARRLALLLGAAAVVSAGVCSNALATPITVGLRVEGAEATLFEGALTTDARMIEAPDYETSSPAHPHSCDVQDNGEFPAGSFGSSYGNPTTALYDAAATLGLTFDAHWYAPLNDFFVDGLGTLGAKGSESWGYAVNDTTASVGGCQFQLAPGSQVLWASNFGFAKHLLSLSGPATVTVGAPFTVHVTDGQTGKAVAEAGLGTLSNGVSVPVPASPLSDSNGDVTLSLTQVGTATLKASRSDSVRSNGLSVCVHSANDGACGTPLPSTQLPGGGLPPGTPGASHPGTATSSDVARIAGLKDGHLYSRRSAPRVLRGTVQVPTGGSLRQVRISLLRRFRGRCWRFSGLSEMFVRSGCQRRAFFSVGASRSFSYLLPARLPRGRYVYDIEAIDAAGVATPLVGGVSHVVFRVR